MYRKLLISSVLFLASLTKVAEAGAPVREADHRLEHAVSISGAMESRRVALVIGNSEYEDNPLGNPVNDARAMSNALGALGFEVMLYENLSAQRMKEAISAFNQRLDAGGTGLFYFAGHGFRVADRTVLAPVDIRSEPRSLLTQGIDLRTVLESMSNPRPGMLNLVILDTCLNDLFNAVKAASPKPPDNTLIAYAAAPGSFAADGRRHGIYTAAWLRALASPGQDIMAMLQQVEAAVRLSTAQQQVPWVSSTLSPDFRFVPATGSLPPMQRMPSTHDESAGAVVALRSRAILPKDTAEQYELTFWDSIKDSNHISDYEAYLNAYPKGRFAALARARIERLRAAAPKTETPSPAPPGKAAQERARPAPPAKAERARPPAREPAAPPAEKQARPAPAEPETPEAPPTGAVSAQEVKDCPACPALVVLTSGAFTMGSNKSDPSEKPAHRVTIGAPFAIGKYEVTVEQWDACVKAGACPKVATDNNRPKNSPVRDVSWDDAQLYVKWLSETSGKNYRLPTEAEWEYAARGGTSARYWWGEQMRTGKANCKECGEASNQEGPANVGSFAANPYGLYDVNGSVWEWVSDCWHNSYKGAPANGRSWDAPNCRERVIRGGSWRDGASYMLSTTRFKYSASVRHSQNGFRVARDAK